MGVFLRLLTLWLPASWGVTDVLIFYLMEMKRSFHSHGDGSSGPRKGGDNIALQFLFYWNICMMTLLTLFILNAISAVAKYYASQKDAESCRLIRTRVDARIPAINALNHPNPLYAQHSSVTNTGINNSNKTVLESSVGTIVLPTSLLSSLFPPNYPHTHGTSTNSNGTIFNQLKTSID